MRVRRLPENPIITPEMDARMGENINGPSLVRVPGWLDDPLGEYYLYFAHHSGSYVRLAYADDLHGPWTVYAPGTLHIDGTPFGSHIASPDVHVDHDEKRIRMYYHGCCGPYDIDGAEIPQATRVALSTDGLDFESRDDVLGAFYFRVWEYDGAYYAVANDGHLYRSTDPLAPFERGPPLGIANTRHFAVRFEDPTTLQLFFSRIGDRPERILLARMDLTPRWTDWEPRGVETVLEPERQYEGAEQPLEPSEKGAVHQPVRQLRDPGVYEEDGRTYLLYSVAGERGIGAAEIGF